MDFTVAIPTYNGAERLASVLEKLRHQIQTENIQWEIIVVDNNSDDSTADVVKGFQQNWHLSNQLKYVFEDKQGMAYARWRAIKEASGVFVGFVDDDNLVFPDWVYQAYHFGIKHTKSGAYGGEIQGIFEIEPPENFDKVKTFLAIRKYADTATKFDVDKLRLPPGAGLVVRKKAWLESVPTKVTHTQRGCEDYEISLHMYNHGWEIWYNPEMQIQHLIPEWRMQKDYLLKIAHTYGRATCQISLMTAENNWQKVFLLFKGFIGSFKRIIIHLIKHRQQVKNNLGLACEMTFYFGQMISPFDYIKKNLF